MIYALTFAVPFSSCLVRLLETSCIKKLCSHSIHSTDSDHSTVETEGKTRPRRLS